MLGPERPEAVLPDRALYLTTVSQLLIVNKLLSRPLVDLLLRCRLLFFPLLPVELLLSPMSIDTGAHDPDIHNHLSRAQVHTEEEEEEQKEEEWKRTTEFACIQ